MENKILRIVLIFLSLITVISCQDLFEDKHHDRFEDPPWLEGSILETLEKDGNYTIFLDLMEKADYTEAIEKGLFTVFVANDSSYNAYFNSIGIDSVSQLSERDAFQLFALNIVNTARSKEQLIYDWVWDGWQKPGSELGALVFRWPTRSQSPIEQETVKYFSDLVGQTIKIQGQTKLVPLFSTDYFRDFNGATDGSDYTYFFPETQWSGLQWYNANIIKAEVRASNGYIYYLDKAVPKIPSIEEHLRNNQDTFGVFYDLAQRFARYSVVGYDTDAERSRLYSKTYGNLFSNFADELGPTPGAVYERKNLFSALIPVDEVMQDYLDNTVLTHYASIDSVPLITLIYIIQAHITNHLELPSKMAKLFYNAYGDIIPIDPYNDVVSKTLLSNGAFFGINKVLEPKAFAGVVGPIFYDSKYSTFLLLLAATDILQSFGRQDIQVTVFAPPNNKLEESGIRYSEVIEDIEIRNPDGVWEPVSTLEQMEDVVNSHIIFSDNTDFSEEGFVELESGNYLYYNNSQLIAGGNREDNDKAVITGSRDSEYNGTLYYLDNPIKHPTKDIAGYIADDPNLSEFFDLLLQVNLLDSAYDAIIDRDKPRMQFLLESEYWTAFLPDNNTIVQERGLGNVPSDSASLAAFLKYHFIKDNVIFDDGEKSGTFQTVRIVGENNGEIEYATLTISNTENNLQITDNSGQTIILNHASANDLVDFGVVHIINSVLKFE